MHMYSARHKHPFSKCTGRLMQGYHIKEMLYQDAAFDRIYGCMNYAALHLIQSAHT